MSVFKQTNNKSLNNITKKHEEIQKIAKYSTSTLLQRLSNIDTQNPDINVDIKCVTSDLVIEQSRILSSCDNIICIIPRISMIENEVKKEKQVRKRQYVRWIPEMNATLIRMRASDKTWDLISQAVDHSVEACKTQYRKIKNH
jgi:hypothetical protein